MKKSIDTKVENIEKVNPSESKLDFNLLNDEPITDEKEALGNFYHANFSPALRSIIENKSCVHTIGLFGRWGTGKSTIISLLKKDLEDRLFIFDAWKYQEDALRRIFLIELVAFLNTNGSKIPDKVLYPLYQDSTITSTETIEKDSEKKWFWKLGDFIKSHKALDIFIILAVALLILEIFAGDHQYVQAIKETIKYLGGLSVVVAVFIPFIEKVFSKLIDQITDSMTPWTVVREKVEKEERLNSPEQFEKKFKEILSYIEPSKRFVIVFDNIDRVQGDTAIKILSTIKTFLDPTTKSNITFLIPCDADAINRQIRLFYGQETGSGGIFDPSEYLRKLFNVIIYTPEFIDKDLEGYIRDQIGKTGEIKSLLFDDDVILVISKAFSSNPREIKQFINNLISTILVAYNTEVKESIVKKENISYLAKVLVLKQKFPQAYNLLKEKWYEPNNVNPYPASDNGKKSEEEKEFLRFMNSTSRITTDNAEPYIYFKEPAALGSISNPQELQKALLLGNDEAFLSILKSEKNKEGVVDYVRLLLERYQNQHSPLLNIYKTQLLVFSEGGFVIEKKDYFDESLKTLDGQLWQDYLDLPVDPIFSFLLSNGNTQKSLKSIIIERYVLALEDDQLTQPGNLEFTLRLLNNFASQPSMLNKSQKERVSQVIEKKFATNNKVIDIFQDIEKQNKFITIATITQFIQGVTRESLATAKDTLKSYKEYIIKNGISRVLLNKIKDLLSTETSEHGNFRQEKESLLLSINKVLSDFDAEIEKYTTDERQQFISIFVQAFDAMGGDWNNKATLTNSLRMILKYVEPNQKDEIIRAIGQFFQNAGVEKITYALSQWVEGFRSTFLAENMEVLLPRAVTEDPLLKYIYEISTKEYRLRIIQHLINNKPGQGMEFIQEQEANLPDRQEVSLALLTKAETLATGEKKIIYNFLNTKISKNDDSQLKELATNQIKMLLKTDDTVLQEAGYGFLVGGNFLSEEKRREIAKEVLEYLRQPGKILNENNSYSLRAILSLVGILQETPKRDFNYLLFSSVSQEKSKAAIDLFLSLLVEIRPAYTEYEKDYKDLLARLEEWPEGEIKQKILASLIEIKPKAISGSSREFWKSIASLIKTDEPVL